MKVKDTIRKRPVTIDAGETVHAAARLMDSDMVGALMVVDNGQLVGIVTDRDIVVRGVARGGAPDARIDSVMSTDVIALGPDDDLRTALVQFRSHPFRRLPVIDEGSVVGMVTADDLLIDLVSDLGDLVRPVTGQTIFGSTEPALPVEA